MLNERSLTFRCLFDTWLVAVCVIALIARVTQHQIGLVLCGVQSKLCVSLQGVQTISVADAAELAVHAKPMHSQFGRNWQLYLTTRFVVPVEAIHTEQRLVQLRSAE